MKRRELLTNLGTLSIASSVPITIGTIEAHVLSDHGIVRYIVRKDGHKAVDAMKDVFYISEEHHNRIWQAVMGGMWDNTMKMR